MKTEQSSQWDGFRHYSQPRNSKDPSASQDRVFYGGTTKDEILDTSNHRIGLQYWAPEGIAGESFALLLVSAFFSLPLSHKFLDFSKSVDIMTGVYLACMSSRVCKEVKSHM